ncbi:glycoprotein 3-alpha-L-fucosyltransferase A-like [Apostichopus japonicus]|uniref:glycoprotein 3-alpha-L-fucosyltransferase A-like n=1 Tax=Stichopus japonicus TaxID=307972 RepID=UPI003AB3E71B
MLWVSLIAINLVALYFLLRSNRPSGVHHDNRNIPNSGPILVPSVKSTAVINEDGSVHKKEEIVEKHIGGNYIKDNILVELVSLEEDWEMKELFNRTVQCPGTKRTIKFHRSYMDFESARIADVVCVISGAAPSTWRNLQEVRNPQQIWMFSTAESAITSPPFPHRNQNGQIIARGLHFNMSFGYHPKFEVYAPFGAYIPWTEQQRENLNILKREISPKPQIDAVGAWASSHCHYDYWNRTSFAHELAKHLPTHMFGDCGDKRLPRNTTGNNVLKKYKFYLAFENICCSFYISEKFWTALADYEAVPIVVGASRAEYEKVAPPNSFIYADDFGSVQDLAGYVVRVANDDSLYQQYHEWRKHGYAEVYHSHRVFPYCDDKMACKLLDYLEKNAWRPGRPLHMDMDLYGPDWVGSCNTCGQREWMIDFNIKSKQFHGDFLQALEKFKIEHV